MGTAPGYRHAAANLSERISIVAFLNSLEGGKEKGIAKRVFIQIVF